MEAIHLAFSIVTENSNESKITLLFFPYEKGLSTNVPFSLYMLFGEQTAEIIHEGSPLLVHIAFEWKVCSFDGGDRTIPSCL